MSGICECHGHIFMDGADYRAARAKHEATPDDTEIRLHLSQLAEAGVVYFRDGGDALGVSLRARELAPEYGIVYRTPAFAIHAAGYYGGIVGREYGTVSGFEGLLKELREQKGDFVKLMLSGILSFRSYGELSCPSLEREQIFLLVRLAHQAGCSVMVHVNGDEAIAAAVDAGADSIEHGYFLSERTVDMMRERGTIWVPTLAAIAAFARREGYDNSVAEETLRVQQQRIRYALERGVLVATGSDSGAWGVPHGGGILTELELLGDPCEKGNAALLEKF